MCLMIDKSWLLTVPDTKNLNPSRGDIVEKYVKQFNENRVKLDETGNWLYGGLAYLDIQELLSYGKKMLFETKHITESGMEHRLSLLDDIHEMKMPVVTVLDRLILGLMTLKDRENVDDTQYVKWKTDISALRDAVYNYEPKAKR